MRFVNIVKTTCSDILWSVTLLRTLESQRKLCAHSSDTPSNISCLTLSSKRKKKKEDLVIVERLPLYYTSRKVFKLVAGRHNSNICISNRVLINIFLINSTKTLQDSVELTS